MNKDEWNIDIVQTSNVNGYRFLPHKVKGEGFFCSVLRKKGNYTPTIKKSTRDHINPWLSNLINTEELNFLKIRNTFSLRLRNRGFERKKLLGWFLEIRYSLRASLKNLVVKTKN